MNISGSSDIQQKLWKQANLLAVLTIFYNIAEGLVSVWFGIEDETLALFGFGADSFVEVISGVAVWHMIRRISRIGSEQRDGFEQSSLRVTGSAFYLLAAGLTVSAAMNLFIGRKPETTLWGVIISLASMSFMWLLIRHKERVGKALASPAILADAACSRACLYLSLVLLAASSGYELTGIGWFDAVGAMLIAWLSIREGREAFQKAKGISCGCSCSCGNE